MIHNDTLFQERKAAQAAAFFIFKAGGCLEILKLMKLLYLAERESLRSFGEMITGDAFVSMPHGPVLSMTYDCINGGQPESSNGWGAWISDRQNRVVSLRDASMLRSPEQDLMALSESDLESLEKTWDEFGHYSGWDLRQLTHNGLCPEWEDPHGSSRPIPLQKLLSILGYSQDDSYLLFEQMKEQAEINKFFSKA